MENNQVTDLKISAIPQRVVSGWKEDIDFQIALQASPYTVESSESFLEDRNSVYYLIRFSGGVAAVDDKGAWVIEMNTDEPNWRAVEVDPDSAHWSRNLPFTQGLRGGVKDWRDAIELATIKDITTDDSTQSYRPSHDLQAEERLGIFTISRAPNVIFTKSIQLTSRLDKRKPNISPYVPLQDEKE